MISQLTHVNIYVLNQDSALDFYTNKLGFNLVDDIPMGDAGRWLTVSPPDQPELEIVLFPINGCNIPEEAAEALIDLVNKGTFGCGVFQCEDVYATYEQLKANGVEFLKAPTVEFYAIEALLKDDSGNYFSLQQKQ
jgi:catechol 2,3-dioxygenase-like lactoylglutathione lyase family enzyme